MVGDAVAAVLRIVAANQAELVELPRQLRHVFTDADAGDARGDGAEIAANLYGGIGLGIERVDMARAALHPK
jgi:hypothetical protein